MVLGQLLDITPVRSTLKKVRVLVLTTVHVANLHSAIAALLLLCHHQRTC